ncbi:ATP-binding SpoIIE family protein phosphatase [Phaeacidiphilus oryzae]|uniref:ATP-binding SpoIIE family protein phosphatase n=1 Tax=Phaeacidiphilus oryzae TaxID=348818 RepID=UPI0007C70107|nr:SpoIIE family protein phosphatase [Phaeacidiphilus oryzae]
MGSEKDPVDAETAAAETSAGAPAPVAASTLRDAGVGLWRTDDSGGRVIALDDRCAELLGLPAEPTELAPDRLRGLLHRADAARLRPAARLAAVQHRPVDLRVRVVDAAGTLVRVLRLRIAPGPPDDPGQPLVGTLTEENWVDTVDEFSVPPTTGPGTDQRELEQRQVEALNRTPGPGTARRGRGTPASGGATAATGGSAEDREDHEGRSGAGGPAGAGARDGDGREPADRAASADAAAEAQRSRAARLLDAGRALTEAENTEDVLRVIAGLDLPGLDTSGQLVSVVEKGRLTAVASVGYPAEDAPFQVTLDSSYPGVEAVRTAEPVFVESPEEYRRRYPAIWPLVAAHGRRSWVYFPLSSGGRTIGTWMLAFRTPTAFTADRRALLGILARMVTHAVERTRTTESERALSLGLLRSMQPRSHGVPGMAAAARYVPTGGGLLVGGDWCDVVDLPDGRLAVVIGDVEGHDVHAATIMSQLRTAVLAYALEGHHPDAVLARASRFLSGLGHDRYATCIYLLADPARGTLDVARAGHPHPVVRMPDGTCLLRHLDGGLPLGMSEFGEEDYPVNRLQLQLGEILMLCTDGLVENGGHDYYTGWLRVRDALSPGPTEDLEGIADRLIEAVHGPESHRAPGHLADRREDDIALILLRRDQVDRPHGSTSRRTVLTINQDEQDRIAGARQELREILHDWAVEDHVDAAVLLASELLANVLVHTEFEAALEAHLSGPPGARTLHVEVSDRSDELPHRRSPGEMASSGRGLVLLEMLSDRWGVQPRGEGKAIWFELDEVRPEGSDSAAGQPN